MTLVEGWLRLSREVWDLRESRGRALPLTKDENMLFNKANALFVAMSPQEQWEAVDQWYSEAEDRRRTTNV